MPTAYDVPAGELIKRITEYLRENKTDITPPSWTAFTKTSAHLERLPQSPDWWYTRCASILRKVYIEGPIGIGGLKKEYGGRDAKGTIGKNKVSGGGAIVRNALQQLEKAGLVKTDKKGRVITQSGHAVLDSLAREVKRDLEKSIPELKKYG
ncbi:MAG: small subunit ribosomal protein S19e [Thermoproteota archaeon]|nr:small subunit ribosomal protein S19e [Thermoproteota archaeon]